MVALEEVRMTDTKKPVIVKITRRRMSHEPEVDAFYITTSTPSASVVDGFGSAEHAEAYLRGLEAMARMLGRSDIKIPDVPDRDEARE